MVFHVYFDPSEIGAASSSGGYGIQALIAVLRGFLQNCILLDFDDWRGGTEIRRQLECMPSDHDRHVVKKLLAQLKKRNRFVCCLSYDYMSEATEVVQVAGQAATAELDLILAEETLPPNACNPAEISNLSGYQGSNFEHLRSMAAAEGRVYVGGEEGGGAFLNTNLRKALRTAKRIDVCDKLLGTKFGDNYRYTAQRFLRWLGEVTHAPSELELTFHCGMPDANRARFMLDELARFRPPKLRPTKIVVQFYNFSNTDTPLPHDRFFLTDQVSIEIGRGMDFLDQNTDFNRDCSINLKNEGNVSHLLAAYASAKLAPELVQ